MKRKIFSILLVLVLVIIFSLMTALPVSADVSVTAATGGDAILADTSADATTPAWTDLGGITIAEQLDGDFVVSQTDVTLILKAPSGFEFNSVQTPSINAAAGDITALTLTSITASLITVTFTTDPTADAGNDSIIIGATTAIQVRPTTGVLPASGNILRDAGSTSTITGIDGATNFGTLTMVAGVATQLAFTVDPASSVSGQEFGTQPTIEAQDQHGNINTGFADDITVSVKTGPGTLLGTATQAMAAGTLTTTGLGYTATADQEDFTLAANDAGNDLTEGVSGIVTCDVVATKLVFTTQPTAGANSGALLGTQPVVAAQDAGDLVDIDFVEIVTITADVGTLSGDVDVAAVAGVATFTDLVHTASADNQVTTLTADDEAAAPDLPTVDADPFTTLVIATKILITTPPANIISGVSMDQPVVEYVDANDITDEDIDADVITVTEDGAGSLAGTTTATAALGVATFTDQVYTATADSEAVTFTFTDDAAGAKDFSAAPVTSAQTADVVATKLVIVTQPTGAESGAALLIQPVINAVDSNGIRDTGWVTACAVTKETGTGDVTGTSVDPMVAGVATFTNVTVTESPVVHDSYTLRFTSTGLDDVVSDAFKVYDKVLDLNDDAWILISTDDYIISSGDDTSVFEGSVPLKYKYTGSGYLQVLTIADLKPVEAIYVKTTSTDGWVGLNYDPDATPGASIKSLVEGWNLIGIAGETNARTILTQLSLAAIGQEIGPGLAAIVSQGDYNLSMVSFYIPTVDSSTWADAGPLDLTELNEFDGYWVYMNVAKSFGVFP